MQIDSQWRKCLEEAAISRLAAFMIVEGSKCAKMKTSGGVFRVDNKVAEQEGLQMGLFIMNIPPRNSMIRDL